MSRLLLALFAVLAIFSIPTLTEASCPENQVWNDCGSACPPTCEEPNPQVCTLQCIAGCECSKGLVKSSSGKCIPASQC